MKLINSVAMMLMMVIALNSCASKMAFTSSSVVPAASGTIKVKKDKNKNYIINVNVLNLAEAKNLNPSKNTYLVWMESRENAANKLGQIAPSGKALQGRLSATSIAEPTQIFITAEDNSEISFPAGSTILTTKK